MPETHDPELAVTYLPVSELVPYERNAKLHPDAQIGQIAASIREFGDCDPIGIWHDPEGRPVIVEGHGRLLALKSMGAETAPCIALDHLSDEERRAYALAHNQTTLTSGFDLEPLEVEMADLPAFDFGAYGFDVGPDVDEFGTDFDLPDEEGPQHKKMTLLMTDAQYEGLCGVLDAMDDPGGGGNAYANKICEVVGQWAEP